jgi:CRP-like cAMP-binding protein
MNSAEIRSMQPIAPLTRLQALSAIGEADSARLKEAVRRARLVPARRDICLEGEPITMTSIIVSGWACRTRLLSDGRRQVMAFLLPGDVIGLCRHRNPVAISAINAITQVTICDAPVTDSKRTDEGLAEAYAISAALDEAYLLNHITRLGRQTAYERLAHLMLEFWERLRLAGIASGNRFPMPLTQEYLGDTLGLTSVHINRTLQQLRREHMLEAANGFVTLLEPEALALIADYKPAVVCRPSVEANLLRG